MHHPHGHCPRRRRIAENLGPREMASLWVLFLRVFLALLEGSSVGMCFSYGSFIFAFCSMATTTYIPNNGVFLCRHVPSRPEHYPMKPLLAVKLRPQKLERGQGLPRSTWPKTYCPKKSQLNQLPPRNPPATSPNPLQPGCYHAKACRLNVEALRHELKKDEGPRP